jgi:mRNA interferase MazF
MKMPYHVELKDLILPPPYDEGPNWAKADMVFAASFSRLDLLRQGKDPAGHRVYLIECLTNEQLNAVRRAILCSLGLSALTKHLP